MTEWQDRTIEQRNLLNPAFCAVVLWHVAKGYQTEAATVTAATAMKSRLTAHGGPMLSPRAFLCTAALALGLFASSTVHSNCPRSPLETWRSSAGPAPSGFSHCRWPARRARP